MQPGASLRIGLATLVGTLAIVLAAALVLAADAARSGGAGTRLLPDLKVQRPYELYVQRKRRNTRLRVSNTVSNKGIGPLEIEGGEDGPQCDGPGKAPGRTTLQNVYEDSENPDSPGYFWRAHEPVPQPGIDAGCSRYHPAHDHWHFDNFARYTLVRERTGKVVGRSRKVSFCVLDTNVRHPRLPGSPGASGGYYPRDPEAPDPDSATCSATSIDGLSVGWEDTYGAALPGQGIKITGLKRGRYCLILEADPADAESPAGRLEELREHNNVRDMRIALRPRSGFVKRLGRHCRPPA